MQKSISLRFFQCLCLLLLTVSVHGAEVAQISQYGVTWKFDKPYPAGQFVTGDWWVIGPVTVTSVTPAPEDGMNGSVVNPKAGVKQGYDKRLANFDPSMRCSFPHRLQPAQSLVSVESIKEPGEASPDAIYTSSSKLKLVVLHTAAVLTCVSSAPPTDAFRPAYVGEWKKVYRASELRRNLLPGLASPKKMPDLTALERGFERPWIDHTSGFLSNYVHPRANMPDYGREITNLVSDASLLLLLADPQKKNETLLLRFVQKGIDNYGVVCSNNKVWTADGGHDSGRKWPIIFAGLLLNDNDLMHVKAAFAEDEQTYYGKGFSGQTALWTIGPSFLANQKHEEVDPNSTTFGKGDNNWKKAEGYRKLNGPTWIGQVLAARIMGAVELWDHPAYFDYEDRWCKEEWNNRFGSAPFEKEMWDTYRAKADDLGAKSKKHRDAK